MRIEGSHIEAERAFAGGRGDAAGEIEAIRAIARSQAHLPALAVLCALDDAARRGGRTMLVRDWLPLLRDAIACAPRDGVAAQTLGAACTVRQAH